MEEQFRFHLLLMLYSSEEKVNIGFFVGLYWSFVKKVKQKSLKLYI